MLTGLKQLKIRFDIRVSDRRDRRLNDRRPMDPNKPKECIGPKDDRDPDITIGRCK